MASTSQLRRGNAEFLCEYALNGTTFRFATMAVSVTSSSGASYQFLDGLVNIEQIERGSNSVAITFAASSYDWALLAARGLDLSAARATLYRWWPGQKLEEATVIIEGLTDQPEYGDKNEPFTFTILADPFLDNVIVPNASMSIGNLTWPVRDEYQVDAPARGMFYPIPIGRPGAAGWDLDGVTQSNVVAQAVCPAYLVELPATGRTGATPTHQVTLTRLLDSYLLFSGVDVQATEVMIIDVSDGFKGLEPVVTSADLLGRTTWGTNFSPSSLYQDPPFPRPHAGHQYYVAFPPGHGGIWNLDRTTYARAAGEVLVLLYTQLIPQIDPTLNVSTKIDVGRMQAQRAYLDQYLLDFVIIDPTTIHEYVSKNLASVLPITWVNGQNGWYWLAWRWDATKEMAKASLNADLGRIRRASRIKAAPSDAMYSQIRVNYAFDASNTSTLQMVVGASDNPNNRRQVVDPRCLNAYQRELNRNGRVGVVEFQVDARVVSDDATALRVAQSLVAEKVTPPMPITYVGGNELEALEIGDVVLLTDSDLYMTDRVCLVESITTGEESEIRLLVLDDTLTTRRTT